MPRPAFECVLVYAPSRAAEADRVERHLTALAVGRDAFAMRRVPRLSGALADVRLIAEHRVVEPFAALVFDRAGALVVRALSAEALAAGLAAVSEWAHADHPARPLEGAG